MTKKYIAIRKTDLFYNSMRLCGNFTKFASIWRENVTHIHAGVKDFPKLKYNEIELAMFMFTLSLTR